MSEAKLFVHPSRLTIDLGDLFLLVNEQDKLPRVSALQLIKTIIKETIYMIRDTDINRVIANPDRLERFIDIVLDSSEYIDTVGPMYCEENILSRTVVREFLMHIDRSGYVVNGKFPYRVDRLGALIHNTRTAKLPIHFIYDKVLDYA